MTPVLHRGDQPEQDADQRRNSDGESQHGAIDVDAINTGNHSSAALTEIDPIDGGRKPPQKLDAASREACPEYRRDRGQQQAFGHHQPQDPSLASTDGRADRHLPLPCDGSNQQQIGDVETGDQEDESDRAHEHKQRGFHRRNEFLLQADGRIAERVGFGTTSAQVAKDWFDARGRRIRGDTSREPRDDATGIR